MPTVSDLGARVRAKYPGVYDALSDAELGARVKAKYPGAYGSFVDPPLGVAGFNPTAYPMVAEQPGGTFPGNYPPMRGVTAMGLGMIGGAIGSVGGIGGAMTGAGIGGSAGAAIDQALGQAPPSLRDIGVQGAKQAGLEVLGGLGAGVAGRLAGPLMRSALGRGASLEMAQAALANKAGVTARGIAKMARRADIAEALAAFAKSGDAEAAQAEADLLKGTHKAMQRAADRGTPRINPTLEGVAALMHPHGIPALAGEAAARYAIGNPTVKSYIAMRLADPAARAALLQSPRALAALYTHFAAADATAGE